MCNKISLPRVVDVSSVQGSNDATATNKFPHNLNGVSQTLSFGLSLRQHREKWSLGELEDLERFQCCEKYEG